MSERVKIVFLLMPHVHLLDLGGVAQIFNEAKRQGLNIEIEYCAGEPNVQTSIGLQLERVVSFHKIKLRKGDYIIIPGSYFPDEFPKSYNPDEKILNWLHSKHNMGVVICSLSNASLLLAKAGVLNDKICTTHWLRIETLKEFAPSARVIENILFCENDGVITSSGAISCLDLGLYLVAKLGGGSMAYNMSKKLLLNSIRKGDDQQISVFLKYRNHTHQGIHIVQDYLAENINQVKTISDLAELANMSERNFTRIFKKETGKTVKEFITELRIEKANQYLAIPDYSRTQIANECGLQSERHLRRILKRQKNENA